MAEALLSSALAAKPDHAALAYGETTLTFRELSGAADRLADAVQARPGERVAIVAPNAPALVIGLFAAWRMDAVAVPLSARLRRFELERAFGDAAPAAVVSVAADRGYPLAKVIAALAQRSSTLRSRIVVDELGEVVQASRVQPRTRGTPTEAGTAAILYTSGTTGEPKGALIPRPLADAMAYNLAEVLGENAGAPYGLPVPASHAFGLGCLLCGVVAGATAILVEPTTSLDPLVSALRRHAALVLHGSPALFGRVQRLRAELPVRGGFVAGSWCPPGVLETLDGRGIRVLNLYGMTEIGAATSCRRGDPPQTRYRTVGRALPGYEVRVAGAEIQVRSSYLPTGYHGRPWNSETLADDSWFRTGDLGELDDAGNLIISGRAKEVIHVGGFNVFPGEVESFLLTHPEIAQAAVIGVPHRVMGEALQAFVVPAPGGTLDPRDVTRFARGGIAGYKVPYSVQIVDELPLLPSGKPDRRALAKAGNRDQMVSR